jgi:hypothetical protein
MQTSTAPRNRGLVLSALFFAAAIVVGIIRWATGDIASDGSFLLVMLFGAASVFTYFKVAGVFEARLQRQQGQTDTGHTAIVTPITAAGRHDAA